MKRRLIHGFVGIIALLCLTSASALADNMQVVVKLVGPPFKLPGAPPREAFAGQVLPGGRVVTFMIVNMTQPQGQPAKFDPDPKVASALAAIKPGEFAAVTFDVPKTSGPIYFTSITPYAIKPGEEDPHAYMYVETFDKKDGDNTTNFITVSKFLQKSILKIPARKDASDDMVADDAILGIAQHLQPGEMVYVVTLGSGANQTVKLIAPWQNHFTGKFGKLDADATVDSNSDTGPAVEITGNDGKTVTALIPGFVQGKKWAADPNILGVAKGLKADADVDYITADSGDKRIWLVAISKSKPAEQHTGISRGNG